MKSFAQYLVESRKSSEDVYNEFFAEFYAKILSFEEAKRLKSSADQTERALNLKPEIEISDSGQMIVKWAEGEFLSDPSVFIIGVLTKTGRLSATDAADLYIWIDRLYQKVIDGFQIITTPNDLSKKLLSRIEKRLTAENIAYEIVDIGPEINLGDSPYLRFRSIALART